MSRIYDTSTLNLTPGAMLQIPARRGDECPHCGHIHGDLGGNVETGQWQATETGLCDECGARWLNHFALIGYSGFVAGLGTHHLINKAFEHVQLYHPEVTHVMYTATGKWLYMDDDGETPKFKNAINVGLLEEAAAVAQLPSIHHYGRKS